MSWQSLLAVAVGGAVGSVVRFGLAVWFKERGWSATFPWGTFVINVTGSFLLAVFAVWLVERAAPAREEWVLLLGTGFCGGYTTFSTFSVETQRLLHEGRHGAALAYAAGSVVGGLVAAWVGFVIARLLFARP